MWNVKAPGTVTIPLSVSAGGTTTVFLGVLYGSSQSSVQATLNVNNTVQRKMTFTDSGDATHDKIVVYAITVKRTDGYYFGNSVVSSWTTEYQYDTVTITQQIGEGAPTAPDSKQQTFSYATCDITPNTEIILKKVTFKTNDKILARGADDWLFFIKKVNEEANLFTAPNTVEIPANTVKTMEMNVTLQKGVQYRFTFDLPITSITSPFGNVYVFATWSSTKAQAGTYGEVDLSYANTDYGVNFEIEYDIQRKG